MKTYIVQLEVHDDVISTRDKISWSKARRILLVWPRKGQVLERRVDLMVIQRYCHHLGSQLALVTRSDLVRENALELGIPVFDNALRAQSGPWRRPRRRRSFKLPVGRRPVSSQDLRARLNALRKPMLLNRWLRYGVFLAGMLAFLSLVFFFMPGARVQVTPAREKQKLTIAVWANSAISAPNLSGGVPAYPIQVAVEGRDQAASTGVTFISDENANGEVEITNLTDQPVSIPAGSVVQTLGDKPIRFLTTQSADLKAGTSEKTVVSIRAALPGIEGNVQAGEIKALEGALGLRVVVNNLEPTHGGTVRTNPAPSAQDYTRLRSKLLEQLQLTALEEIQAQIQPDQRLLYQSIQQKSVVSEQRSPEIDQPADQLQLTLQVEYQAWMVKESDLRVVAQTALDANLPGGYEAVPDSLRLAYVREPVFDSTGNARWELDVERTIEAGWSKDRIIQLVQGRSPEEAEKALQSSLSLGAPPKIDLFPAWWIRLPFLPFRIEVIEI